MDACTDQDFPVGTHACTIPSETAYNSLCSPLASCVLHFEHGPAQLRDVAMSAAGEHHLDTGRSGSSFTIVTLLSYRLFSRP